MMLKRRLVAWLLIGGLLMTVPFSVRSQVCGYSFAKFAVADSEGEQVPDATIELLALLPYARYLSFAATRGSEGSVSGVNFKLSVQEFEDLLKQAVPLQRSTDVCGNPPKQRANSSAVFNRLRTSGELDSRKASVKYFGFCTSENDQSIFLLRVSAPHYTTEHYLGSYLGGCRRTYSLDLTKSVKSRH